MDEQTDSSTRTDLTVDEALNGVKGMPEDTYMALLERFLSDPGNVRLLRREIGAENRTQRQIRRQIDRERPGEWNPRVIDPNE